MVKFSHINSKNEYIFIRYFQERSDLMFIYNLKLNGNVIFRTIIISLVVVALIILGISVYNFIYKSSFTVSDSIPFNSITSIESNEYTNILKQVYDNLDTHVGQSINFTGYVYKLYDFSDSQFVIARDMIINSDSQSVVVGFLCSYKNAKNLKQGTWVNVTGQIVKGYYHNEIPVIEINNIEETTKPEDEFVYPPDNSYIPTSVIF